jgi:hypothetical protein
MTRERERVIFTSSLSYGITEFVVEEMGGGRIEEGDTRAIERAREVQRSRRRRRREHNNVTRE